MLKKNMNGKGIKLIIYLILIIILFSLGVFATQQSHPLSEIDPIDQLFDMGSYGVNTNNLNVGGGYLSSGATIDSDGNIKTVGNLTFYGNTFLLNIMETNHSLEIDGSVTINGPLYLISTNNVLNIAAAGSAATNNLYWGNNLLCDATKSNCGWANEVEDIWVKRIGDIMSGSLNMTVTNVGLNVINSIIGVNSTGTSYGGTFSYGDYGIYGTGGDYGVYGINRLNTTSWGYLGGENIGAYGNNSNIGVKGESVLNAVKGINLIKNNTIGYLATQNIEAMVFYGVYGISDDYGVYGSYANDISNFGYLGGEDEGVYGEGYYGVYGESEMLGVVGFGVDSGYSIGIIGIGNLDADNTIGVVGTLVDSYDFQITDVAVYGFYNSTNYGYLGSENIGVYGEGISYGVKGNGTTYGVYGVGEIGVYGGFDNNQFGYIGHVANSGESVGYVQRNSDHYAQLAYHEVINVSTMNVGIKGIVESVNNYNIGLYGQASNALNLSIGVYGEGIYGVHGDGGDYGVYGEGDMLGVIGFGNNIGILGFGNISSDNAIGVVGVLQDSHNIQVNNVGVYGAYDSNNYGYLGGDGIGVYGKGHYGVYGEGYYGVFSEHCVYGESDGVFGVYGNSSSGIGVYGEGEIGVKGFSDDYCGVYAQNKNIKNYGLLGSFTHGARGVYNYAQDGYLGGSDYAVYGEHDDGPYGYLAGNEYAAYGQYNSNNYGALASDEVGARAHGSTYGAYITGDAGIYGIYNIRRLHVGGRAQFPNIPTGALSWDLRVYRGFLIKHVSSKRYKTNITDFETNFTKILDLQPKSFIFKNSNSSGIGYIAEELDEMGLNELVIYENNTVENIAYEYLSYYTLEILKEQEQEIQNKEELIEIREQDIEHLKQQIEELRLAVEEYKNQ